VSIAVATLDSLGIFLFKKLANGLRSVAFPHLLIESLAKFAAIRGFSVGVSRSSLPSKFGNFLIIAS